MIIRSIVIRLEIGMVVHTNAEMVLTIITMGTGAKTGIIIEVSAVEMAMCLQELFQDLYGHLRLLTLLSFFILHQCGLLVATLDSMVWCINVMMISFDTRTCSDDCIHFQNYHLRWCLLQLHLRPQIH